MYAVERPFRLDQGDVSFDAPETMKDAMRAAIDANQTHYLQTAGLPRLKALLAAKLRARNGVPVRSEDEVLVTNGGVHGIYLAAQALVEPGDEVIVPDPEWPPATLAMLAARASVVRCPLHPSLGWRLDVDELASMVGPRTKGLYLNSPNNPTGGVLSRGDIERIADLARAHDLWVISDEAYEDVLYDGAEHVSIASLPGMYERTVPVCTLSKTYAATGVRVGYLAVRDERLRDRVQKLLFLTTSNVSSISQHGAIGALEGSQDDRRGVPVRAAGSTGPLLRGHPRGGRARVRRRTAGGRLLRVPADRPVVGAAGRRQVVLAFVGDGGVPDRTGPHRLRARRGLRPRGRGIRAVLFRTGSGRSCWARWSR